MNELESFSLRFNIGEMVYLATPYKLSADVLEYRPRQHTYDLFRSQPELFPYGTAHVWIAIRHFDAKKKILYSPEFEKAIKIPIPVEII